MNKWQKIMNQYFIYTAFKEEIKPPHQICISNNIII